MGNRPPGQTKLGEGELRTPSFSWPVDYVPMEPWDERVTSSHVAARYEGVNAQRPASKVAIHRPVRAKPRIAVVGAGNMGENHARVVASSPNALLHVVIDVNGDRARLVADRQGVKAATDLEAALECDAVIVASTTDTHIPLTTELLRAGKPVLVEKPIATSAVEVERLLCEAERRSLPLMCGFVERFNPALVTVTTMLESPPIHFLGIRHSQSPPYGQSSVVYELLIHDLDVALRLAPSQVEVELNRSIWRRPDTGVADIVDCTLRMGEATIVNLSASRASHRKIRQYHIVSAQALYEIDLLRADVTVYRHADHRQVVGPPVSYQMVTMIDIPFIRHDGEPLALQFNHFLDLVNGGVDIDAERRSILPPHRLADRVEG